MDVLRSMKIFKRVVELGSFTKVANEMGVTQSSISKNVSALEKRLNITLLVRSTRSLKITDAGQEYYERCRNILGDIEEAESTISKEHSGFSGPIRINLPDTFGRLRVLPHLFNFLDKNPDIEMDIILDDHRIDLVKEGVDVAFRSGSNFDPTWITRKLCDIPRTLVASPEYLKKFGIPETIQDLRNHECIIYALSPESHIWRFLSSKIRVFGRVKVSSPEVAVLAAQKGLGITLSPEWLVKDVLKKGELETLIEEEKPIPFEVHAIFPERRFIPTRVRNLVTFLKKNISS